jgi:alpha-L-fucosidase 2
LQIKNPFVASVRAAQAKLFLPQIGEDGRLMEWAKPFDEPSKGHRHVSHLYAVHPGAQYTYTESPEMMAAARKSIDCRLEPGLDDQFLCPLP